GSPTTSASAAPSSPAASPTSSSSTATRSRASRRSSGRSRSSRRCSAAAGCTTRRPGERGCNRRLTFDQIPHRPFRREGGPMEAGAQSPGRRFDHLREHSIGLPQVLFQSITHMAPAAAIAYSIYISVPDARQALPLSVGLALIACVCAATAIGQLAKLFPSAGGLYTYAARSLGPWAGVLV